MEVYAVWGKWAITKASATQGLFITVRNCLHIIIQCSLTRSGDRVHNIVLVSQSASLDQNTLLEQPFEQRSLLWSHKKGTRSSIYNRF